MSNTPIRLLTAFTFSLAAALPIPLDEAQALLRSRYPQLRAMRISDRPVIALRIERTTSWGDLSAP